MLDKTIRYVNIDQMKGLYRLHVNNAGGRKEGVFVAKKEDVDRLVKNKTRILLEECILGDYYSTVLDMDENSISLISEDQELVKAMESLNLCHGINPFELEPL